MGSVGAGFQDSGQSDLPSVFDVPSDRSAPRRGGGAGLWRPALNEAPEIAISSGCSARMQPYRWPDTAVI
jgi:hypothetical protein